MFVVKATLWLNIDIPKKLHLISLFSYSFYFIVNWNLQRLLAFCESCMYILEATTLFLSYGKVHNWNTQKQPRHRDCPSLMKQNAADCVKGVQRNCILKDCTNIKISSYKEKQFIKQIEVFHLCWKTAKMEALVCWQTFVSRFVAPVERNSKWRGPQYTWIFRK